MGKATRYVTPTDHEISERMAMAVSNYEMGMLGIEGGVLSSAVAGAFVTAGIAASDVICGVKQGKYVKGDDHSSAITLLKEVDAEAGKSLAFLLSIKNRVQYEPYSEIPADDQKRAQRAIEKLIYLAESLV